MAPRRRGEGDADGQPLLKDAGPSEDEQAGLLRLSSRALSRGSTSSRLKHSHLSRRSVYELENRDSDVAFTIVVKRDGEAGEEAAAEFSEAAVDISHDAVNEAVQDAVQDACGQAVQDAVQEAVQDAIQQALEENVKFDVRANGLTLIAITGVIIFWRGIWSLWDKLFGFSIWSELGSIGVGLVIMISFRLANVALLDGLPSG